MNMNTYKYNTPTNYGDLIDETLWLKIFRNAITVRWKIKKKKIK